MAGWWDILQQTWPARAVQSTISALALPGDVYAGRTDPMSDEAIGRSFDLAGSLTLGAGAVPASANELRAGLTLNSKPKLIEAYHGTNSAPFDVFQSGLVAKNKNWSVPDVGVHVTTDPNMAAFYAGMNGIDNITSLEGSRIYPVIVDPGNTAKFGFDPGNWGNTGNWRDYLFDIETDGVYVPKSIKSDLVDQIRSNNVNIEELLKGRGYDSVEYPTYGENVRDSVPAWMVFDPNRVTPKFSPQNQSVLTNHEYKPAKKYKFNMDPEELDYFRSLLNGGIL